MSDGSTDRDRGKEEEERKGRGATFGPIGARFNLDNVNRFTSALRKEGFGKKSGRFVLENLDATVNRAYRACKPLFVPFFLSVPDLASREHLYRCAQLIRINSPLCLFHATQDSAP